MNINKTNQNSNYFLFGFLVTAIGIIFLCVLFFNGENRDVINTKALGIILCKEQGMIYDYREIFTMHVDNKQHTQMPKIYCRTENETQLIDGIVVTQEKIKKESMAIK